VYQYGSSSLVLKHLKERCFLALVDALIKPTAALKVVYLKKISLSSTMGVGIRVDQSTVV